MELIKNEIKRVLEQIQRHIISSDFAKPLSKWNFAALLHHPVCNAGSHRVFGAFRLTQFRIDINRYIVTKLSKPVKQPVIWFRT